MRVRALGNCDTCRPGARLADPGAVDWKRPGAYLPERKHVED